MFDSGVHGPGMVLVSTMVRRADANSAIFVILGRRS
jgi:hypothetical protein